MKFRTQVYALVAVAVLSIALIGAARAANSSVPGWDPNAFRDLSTLQIMTVGPEEGEHWSKLWLVVIDGQVYVRLGDRSFGRVQKNTANPYVKVKVGDNEFDKVKLEGATDMTDKVAAAMADKYFMDILIRHESHPMTARLVPEPTAAK
jgi:alpha-acetolactate decarboxylase